MGPKLYFSTRRWECFLKRKLSSRIILPNSVPWILDSWDIKRQYVKLTVCEITMSIYHRGPRLLERRAEKGEREEVGEQISHNIYWILLANLNTFSETFKSLEASVNCLKSMHLIFFFFLAGVRGEVVLWSLSGCLLSAEVTGINHYPSGNRIYFSNFYYSISICCGCVCVYIMCGFIHATEGYVGVWGQLLEICPVLPLCVPETYVASDFFYPLKYFYFSETVPLCSPGCPQIASTPALVSYVKTTGMSYSHGQLKIIISNSPFLHSASWRFAEWRSLRITMDH